MERDTSSLGPALTMEGIRILSERARALQDRVIPDLLQALEDRGRDGRVDAEFERTTQELEGLISLLRRARAIGDLPDDPRIVEVGDTVVVRFDDGTSARHTIVHPVEAALDAHRISSESPLSRALLGRGIGDEVEVAAPSGRYRCFIVSAMRMDATATRR